MTNADMIRSMSDEELAANLMCPNEMGIADIPCDNRINVIATSVYWIGCVSQQWRKPDEIQICPAIQQAGKESNGGNSRTTDTQKP